MPIAQAGLMCCEQPRSIVYDVIRDAVGAGWLPVTLCAILIYPWMIDKVI